MLLFAAALLAPSFWAPTVPPRALYRVEAAYAADRIEGTATVSFRNTADRSLRRIAIRWHGDTLRVTVNGRAIDPVPGKHEHRIFDVPADIEPGNSVEFTLSFGAAWKVNPTALTSSAFPRIWWGFWTHDDYEVRLRFPDDFSVGATGRLENGIWRAKDVRAFGIFTGKAHLVQEADAGPTRVRVLHTEAGKTTGDLILRTAVDTVNFYRERFGAYPHDFLTIVPGGANPNGGYPVATGLVVVHGQEQFTQRPADFWRWITAHEIGHQYFGEHTVARGVNSLDWLMIGLGIHADREYRSARAIKPPVGALWQNYVNGVREGLDTTMDISFDHSEHVKFDFNNIVIHGKSNAMLNALESVMGAAAFDAAFRRAIREYKGKRLSSSDFQRLCEAESGQDLDWFWEQWTRTPRNLDYRVAGNTVERKGSLRMPVPVLIRTRDGAERRITIDRFSEVTEIPEAKEILVDPDRVLAIAEAPPESERPFRDRLRDLPWTGAGQQALAIYHDARKQNVAPANLGTKLAILLYDGKHYAEALEVFSAHPNPFVGHVWRGHILDLLGRREEALAAYNAALPLAGSQEPRYGQYKLTINKAWVEERLKTPFTRE